jgi:hypothetical protein
LAATALPCDVPNVPALPSLIFGAALVLVFAIGVLGGAQR